MAGDHDEFAPVVGERVIEGQTSALNARETVELSFELTIERGYLRQRVSSGRPVHAHFHAVLHLVSEVLMLELVEAARQHGGTGDEHNRQGGLHNEQRFAGERRTILRAASRSPQRFRRIGARGKPGGSRAKNDSGYERQGEGKRQYHERWRGADGKEMGAVEGERKQQTGRSHGHQKPDNAAANGEQDAFRERLHDDLPGSGADGQSHRRLATTRYSASEQQVRHVGTGNQKHQATHRQKDLQAASVLLFHHRHTGSGGY